MRPVQTRRAPGCSRCPSCAVLQILQRVLPESLHGRLAYLSGPSFAAEVARELPTVVTIAARDDAVAAHAQALLSTPRFRCYRTTDVVGEHP
jgi:glycerol-3-phosphate dehydrogenase (NAD(P)+)